MRAPTRLVLALAIATALTTGIATLVLTPDSMSAPSRQVCGGILGTPCPEGFTCVDDPRDDCNPRTGGADCIGYCRRSR